MDCGGREGSWTRRMWSVVGRGGREGLVGVMGESSIRRMVSRMRSSRQVRARASSSVGAKWPVPGRGTAMSSALVFMFGVWVVRT
ncbi:hypothetical protein Sjap_004732 [Stephania japonica]|uniref:Uncharacterized protein n=1 Tax=Stephania japonica TaxID=461633 RepID=A0AAP0K417_9MAGN